MVFEAKHNRPRILISRPLGGLNDTFCQIQKALVYEEETSRHLFLDTNESGLLGPFEDFFRFKMDHPRVTLGFPDEERVDWDKMSVTPAELEGRVNDFLRAPFPNRFELVKDGDSHAVRLPHGEVETDAVVHHQRGGGQQSKKLLSKIEITSDVLGYIREATSDFPELYAAIHIRATDYTTDYVTVVKRLAKQEKRLPVLVCSDNPSVVTHAAGVLGKGRLLSFPSNPAVDAGFPLHDPASYQSMEARKMATYDLLRDVYAMSEAQVFYFSPIEQRSKFGEIRFSGLTLLISHLQKNPTLRESFFSFVRSSEFARKPQRAEILADLTTKAQLIWQSKPPRVIKHNRTSRDR